MKIKMLAILIVIVMMVSIVSGKVSTDPITEDSFKYNSSSKSEIKEKDLITINITPFLSSGKKLDRKIHEKELPLDQLVTNLVEHVNNGVKKTKVVQIYPEMVLEVSDDAETIKQSAPNGGKLKHEIYYGYQNLTDKVPWKKYYRVENCNTETCRVVRANFTSRIVTVTHITLSEANAITGLPAYEVLP